VKEIRGRCDGSGVRVGVIVSRWNELITKELLEGAVDELQRAGVSDIEIVHVPGTWEIPPIAKALLSRSENPVDGIVALGCILQGQTPHAKLLGSDVGGALMGLQVAYAKPVAWGILTPDTQEQALDRAGLKLGNKGREAALAALEVISALRQL
jgi:6,7-dimethyl-8-ribityllumazine synthase